MYSGGLKQILTSKILSKTIVENNKNILNEKMWNLNTKMQQIIEIKKNLTQWFIFTAFNFFSSVYLF